MIKEFPLKAQDGMELSCAMLEKENPIALVQIVHGAKEHKERYYDFIEVLGQLGYAVIISDNRGHGNSVNGIYSLGFMDGIDELTEDQFMLTEFFKRKYPDRKLYLFGHSFGSCIARKYIQEHDDEIEKLVLSGVVNYHRFIKLGLLIGQVLTHFSGKKGRSRFLAQFSDNGDDSWVVKNPEVLEAYRKDPLCSGYKYTNGAIMTIMESVMELKNYRKFMLQNTDLKILCISGEEDPITGGPAGLADTLATLHRIGYKNVENKVYTGMKHEVLNEINKQQVYEDVIKFLSEN